MLRKPLYIEPHPSAFNEMLENIRLNNIEDSIIPTNVGVSRNCGRICIKNINVGRNVEHISQSMNAVMESLYYPK